MYNYYNFNNLNDDSEFINYYNSMSGHELNVILNNEFDDIDYYLNYYAEFLKDIFNGTDYNEHYYTMRALLEGLNDIKIILNILKERDNND